MNSECDGSFRVNRRSGMMASMVLAMVSIGALAGLQDAPRSIQPWPTPEPYKPTPPKPREKTAADFAAIARAEERRKRKAERKAERKELQRKRK